MLCLLCGDGFTLTSAKDRICPPCWASGREQWEAVADQRRVIVGWEDGGRCPDCKVALEFTDAAYAGPSPGHCPQCGETWACGPGGITSTYDDATRTRITFLAGFEGMSD